MPIMGDYDEVHAAVSNLIDNAVKYSGTDNMAIEVSTNVIESRLAIRVKGRERDCALRIEANFQALLPRTFDAGVAREGHGAWPLHRAIRGEKA